MGDAALQLKELDLFSYRDYREFLRDWFEVAKKRAGSMSYRLFSKRAGLKSPNFLKLVIENQRGLSIEGIQKFATGLKLNRTETEYFKHLVLMNQTTQPEEQFVHYRKMVRSQKFARVKPVEKDQFHLYSEWYHPVIRELISSKEFDGTPEWLCKKIIPQLTVNQVEKSIQLLERLGFIRKTEEGKWALSEPVITTGPESQSLILLHYHQQLLRLCADHLPEVPPEKRDVSNLTIGIQKQRIGELKKRIQEFRRQIVSEFATDLPAEEVVTLNLQMLPLTWDKI